MTPREYISFSQIVTIEKDMHTGKHEYLDIYLDQKEQYTNKNMRYGSRMAKAMEIEEASGDPLLDLVITRLPKLDRMDKAVEVPPFSPRRKKSITYFRDGIEYHAIVPVLKDGKKEIPILALPDTAKSDYTAIKEYKQSVKMWTQKMANESSQITFYAFAVWLATGKIPEDIELVCAKVEYDKKGKLRPTGDIGIFQTTRGMIDIIKMSSRIKRAWKEINKVYDAALI